MHTTCLDAGVSASPQRGLQLVRGAVQDGAHHGAGAHHHPCHRPRLCVTSHLHRVLPPWPLSTDTKCISRSGLCACATLHRPFVEGKKRWRFQRHTTSETVCSPFFKKKAGGLRCMHRWQFGERNGAGGLKTMLWQKGG